MRLERMPARRRVDFVMVHDDNSFVYEMPSSGLQPGQSNNLPLIRQLFQK